MTTFLPPPSFSHVAFLIYSHDTDYHSLTHSLIDNMATLNYPSSNQPDPITYLPYTASHNPTPLSSATATPTTLSPTLLRSNSSSTTLPHLGFQTRQLRPPKSPLYIPAVLRPTERPARYKPNGKDSRATSPLTPPQSAGNSFDGADAGILSFCSSHGIPRRLIGEGAFCGVTRIVSDEWNEDMMEDVTGLPTQDHWKVYSPRYRLHNII